MNPHDWHTHDTVDGSQRRAPNRPQHHTHLQQVARCLQVGIGGGPGC